MRALSPPGVVFRSPLDDGYIVPRVEVPILSREGRSLRNYRALSHSAGPRPDLSYYALGPPGAAQSGST